MSDLQRAIKWLENEEQRVSQEFKADVIPIEFVPELETHAANCRALLDALRWVPLSEREPTKADADQYGEVLIAWASGVVGAAHYLELGDQYMRPGVTHWKPMPKAPEGSE